MLKMVLDAGALKCPPPACVSNLGHPARRLTGQRTMRVVNPRATRHLSTSDACLQECAALPDLGV